MMIPDNEMHLRWDANASGNCLQPMEHSYRENVSAQAINAFYRADGCSRLTPTLFG
jgi:hypothetical protein